MNYEGDLTVNLLLDRESLLRKTMTNWLNGIYPTRTGFIPTEQIMSVTAFLDILNDRGEVEGQNSFSFERFFQSLLALSILRQPTRHLSFSCR